MKNSNLLIGSLLLACSLNFHCNSFKSKSGDDVKISDAYNAYILNHTSGVISKLDRITIDFKQEIRPDTDFTNHVSIAQNPPGSWELQDGDRVVFVPSEPFVPEKVYTIQIDLDGLFESVPNELVSAFFKVTIMKPDFEIIEHGLKFMENDPNAFTLTFTLNSSDHITNDEAEKMFSLQGVNDDLTFSWEHINSRIHKVSIHNIIRQENTYEIPYKVVGKVIQSEKTIDQVIRIPAKGDFRVLDIRSDPLSANHIEILFSDPLNKNQNLNGLIEIEDIDDYTYQITGNQLEIFINTELKGVKKIKVFDAIQNHESKRLKDDFLAEITFELIPPSVRFSKGTILPSSNGTSIQFESMNLKAIDVAVHKIYTSNIPQYLQENRLKEVGNIHRVGKKVMLKTIPLKLDMQSHQNKWVRHHLELNELFKTEPGAIYQIELSFRKPFAMYPCISEDTSDVSLALEVPAWNTDPSSNDNYWQNYYPQDYNWQYRDDPCHVSYYSGDRKIAKNILVSDLGMIAKVGNDKNVHIFTTNLISASPEPDVEIEFLDYQLQTLLKTQTDALGMVTVSPEIRPFLAIASKYEQKSYLRLDDGQSLPVSHFNVSGEQVNEGLKVFIYGERGVWRPGDSLYLSCIIDDSSNPLPEAYPIKFRFKNPLGVLMEEQISALTEAGLLTFRTKTMRESLTGTWQAEIILGQQTFSKSIKIESIKPNRLKAEFILPQEIIPSHAKMVSGKLKISWLTGVPGKNLSSEYALNIRDKKDGFEGFEQYDFHDASREIQFDEITAFKTISEENGESDFSFMVPNIVDAPGKLEMILQGKIFEPSGNFSIDSRRFEYAPYSAFVGMVLPENPDQSYYDPGSNIQVETVVLSENGKLISGRNLNYKLFRMSWRWWWDQSGSRANYVSSQIREEISSGSISIHQGKSSISIPTPNHGGRYYLQICDEKSGHCTGEELYVSWVNDSDQNPDLGANVLAISTDKETYEVGQEIEISIPGNVSARALLTLENGSSIIRKEWIDLTENENIYRAPATQEMAPNMYIHVSLIQPHAQTENDLPMRLYGVVPVKVQDPNSLLNPEIKMLEKLEPEKEFTVQISEAEGQPMSYTIALVDEGLLDITNFKTPDPWQHFYAKEALGVKTWDLYDQVIGSYGNTIERLLAIGGDGVEEEGNTRDANRFEPVVKFLGPFQLDANRNNKHQIKLPNYVGSVRTMVIGRHQNRYGMAEKSNPVIKPLMVLGTLPRVLGPGEQCTLPVSVFALDNSVQSVKIEIETEGVLLKKGPGSKTIVFNEPGDKIIDFNLVVTERLGIGRVIIKATSGNNSALHRISLNSRIANPVTTVFNEKVLKSNEKVRLDIPIVGIPGTNKAVLELSSLPPLNLEKRMQYLIGYPHGCLEQTTSKAFPQLYLEDLLVLDQMQKLTIQEHVNAAITKISRFQTTNGGFSYWPDSGEDHWTTSYAGQFLLEARKKGFAVPEMVLQSFLRFQSRVSRSWTRHNQFNNDIQQAFRLYTLALGSAPELGLMNRLREDSQLSWMAQWYLASTYATVGQSAIAASIIAKLHPSNIPVSPYRNTYGSAARNKAIILETYLSLHMEEESFALLKELAEELSSEAWMSTQTTGYTLKAIGKTLEDWPRSAGINANVNIGGAKVANIASSLGYHQTEIQMEGLSELSAEVENQLDQVLFARIIASGKPKAGTEMPDHRGLKCQVAYMDQYGQTLDLTEPLQQGADFKILTTVTNLSANRINEIALTQILPSGWEIMNKRLVEETQISNQNYTYQDIRDDRVYTYFDLGSGQKVNYLLRVNNTYSGSFYLPGTIAEAMYDHTLFARTAGQWITITE